MASQPQNIRIPVSFNNMEKGLKKSIEDRAHALQKSSSQYLKDLAREDLREAQEEENKYTELFNLILGTDKLIPKQIIKDAAPTNLKRAK